MEAVLTDPRYRRLAKVLVDFSTNVQPGDRVALRSTTAGEPLIRELYRRVLERGGLPEIFFWLPDQEEILLKTGNESQLDHTPPMLLQALEEFDVYIRARAATDLHALDEVDPARQSRWETALSPLLRAQMRRGAEGSLRWLATIYPTEAYARQAGMSRQDFEDFFFQACHIDDETPDPVAHWEGVEARLQNVVERIQGHDRVEVRGPDVDLSLSIRGRTFKNASGHYNMPDGEIFTSPVEDSINGWVKYTYPAIRRNRVVEGVSLRFEDGRVVEASAKSNEAFLQQMLDIDAGARYVGEFAIGTNFEIDRFSGLILFDEKIGGTFHMALGAGYPETGSQNESAIHWDMICDLRQDSEILVDGEVIYRNGAFTL